MIIIDGYNLIKQVLGVKRLSHKQRDAFVQELSGYLKKRKLQGKIVFDGGESSYQYRVKKGSVEVIFSGYKESADDVILRYLDEYKGHQVVLVSSDRELRDYAHTLGKESIGAPEFYKRFVDTSMAITSLVGGHDPTLYKLSEDAPSDLDQLMIEATDRVETKDVDREVPVSRERASHKASKKEKKRRQVFDKLK